MGTTVQIDGQPVAQATARAFQALAADFHQRTGYTLHVTSGLRTYAQQAALYRAWIQRLPGANLAASPDNPTAAQHMTGRALDLHDSGADAGVSVIGSPRHRILTEIAPAHGFRATGETFTPAEGWHYEYWAGDPYAAAPKPQHPTTTKENNIMGKTPVTLIRKASDGTAGGIHELYVDETGAATRLISPAERKARITEPVVDLEDADFNSLVK